ncbi:hypothetical protein FKM82_017961 [Ascaphus truei]
MCCHALYVKYATIKILCVFCLSRSANQWRFSGYEFQGGLCGKSVVGFCLASQGPEFLATPKMYPGAESDSRVRVDTDLRTKSSLESSYVARHQGPLFQHRPERYKGAQGYVYPR